MKKATRALLPALVLVSLSAVAGPPDTEAVEYYNARNNHFFVTAAGSESRLIDDGGAGEGWMRTGRTFQAWLTKAGAPPDAHPVCRFYSVAANSHFYTASEAECAQLRALESAERAQSGTVRGWQYEGVAFYIQTPSGDQCPAGTVGISRVYNDGFRSGEGSNHRFVDDSELERVMQDRSWVREGTAMCASAKSGSGNGANLPPTLQRFEALVGTWNGTARWKSEGGGQENKINAPLSLVIAADGTVSGEGQGCTFTGQVNAGDGYRSYFRGTVSASGCTNPAFNGDYRRLDLERFGKGTLFVQMKREGAGFEASIQAQLASNDAPLAPVGGSFASVAGDWVGTVAWTAEVETATSETETTSNKPLSLAITAAGAVTGEGFGCTITGTLLPLPDSRSGFGGTLEAAGCTEAIFNGTFMDVRIKREGSARIEARLKREVRDAQGKTEVEIEGTLVASGTVDTPPPPPPAAAPLVTGAWTGPATWIATERRNGVETTLASGTQDLSFTVSDSGALAGTGFGCTFTGQLQLSADKKSVLSGSVTASGCTEAAFNGTYADVEFSREDGGLEVELERETESGGLRTKAKIKARVSRPA